jgi:hypothetical protein
MEETQSPSRRGDPIIRKIIDISNVADDGKIPKSFSIPTGFLSNSDETNPSSELDGLLLPHEWLRLRQSYNGAEPLLPQNEYKNMIEVIHLYYLFFFYGF